MKTVIALMVVFWCSTGIYADAAAKITRIEGAAQIMKKSADTWRPARLNMPVQIGDRLATDVESLIEITYRHGAVLRLGELSKCSIRQVSDDAVSTSVPQGNVWVNMKKLSSVGRQFDVSTPTAVAAIRGTIFQLQALPDSSAEVAVFDGKVAVGLSDNGKKRVHSLETVENGGPIEVPGPTEVPGPYEVTLDQWRTIIAGQRISIRSDGRFSTESFDLKKKLDAFVEKNRALDSEIKGAR